MNKFKWLFLLLFIAISLVINTEAFADLRLKSAVLVDMTTGKTLYSKSSKRKIPPASLTKIMTMYVALDYIKAGKIKLSDKVKISKRAGGQGGSRMHIKTGETVTLDRLLFGVAVSSGNDAATAVAEHIAGTELNFVKLMNKKAKQLGMKNTVFQNASGLPAKHQITTAHDLMLLSKAYIKRHPNAFRYHKTKSIKHRGVTTKNKNPLLADGFKGADGLKTGWIRASGYNLISTAKRGKTRILCVSMGSPNSKIRSKEVKMLVEAGFKSVQSKGKIKVSSLINKQVAQNNKK